MTFRVWNKAFDMLTVNEGGYVDDKKDTGGETKYGISKKQYPDLDIPSLTICQARDIYYRDYWTRCKCDLLPDCLSFMVFDFAVNSGCSRAVKTLQECLGVTVDGKIGNATLGAANSCKKNEIVQKYSQARLDFLQTLKGFKRFGKGWTTRVVRVEKIAESFI